MNTPDRTCTFLLEGLRDGREGAWEELFGMVHAELRRIAGGQMREQSRQHTLQPTALVNEAFLKLVGTESPHWNDRGHFLRAAAAAMRSILVDHARAKATRKRDRGGTPLSLDLDGPAQEAPPPLEILQVHEALERLQEIDPRRAQVVELRYFGGLTLQETAQVMDLAVATVHGVWEHARSWLAREVRR